MSRQSNLTVKGQVTIPKDVRDALGLKPGEPVEIDWPGGDEVILRKGRVSPAEKERRYQAALARIDKVVEKYRHLRTGQSTDEYMAEIREPLP